MNAERSPRFRTTQWSLVVAASAGGGDSGRRALAELCESYWYPLYAFARRSGADPDAALDQTQGFFADLLEKNVVARADRERGRFRTFLIAAFRHWVGHERRKAGAVKRGAGQSALSLDAASAERRYGAEPAEPTTPEKLYERRFALTLLERALRSLRHEYVVAGNRSLFDDLEPLLAGGRTVRPYAEIGDEHEMSEAAVKVAAHRLKKRYAARLREVVAAIVDGPDEIDAELRHLITAVGR